VSHASHPMIEICLQKRASAHFFIMPRGYFKNITQAGHKQSRGGSSRYNCTTRNYRRYRVQRETKYASRRRKSAKRKSLRGDCEDYPYQGDYANHAIYEISEEVSCGEDEYELLDEKCASREGEYEESLQTNMGECMICYDFHPLIRIFNKCRHAGACHDCLRSYYVTSAQTDSYNYPLRCFVCRKPMRDTQLKRHGLIKHPEELVTFYRMTELAKCQKITDHQVCSICVCGLPRVFAIGSHAVQTRRWTCRQCGLKRYFVVEWKGEWTYA